MRKYIFLIFVLLFPYIPMILIANSFPFGSILWISIITFLCAFSAGVVNLICAVCRKRQPEKLSLINMLIKLIHIPAYIIFFFIAAGGMVFVKFIAVTLIIFLYDCAIIMLSGLVGLSASISADAEKKISKESVIFFGLTSFVFCIDVISAVVLYIKIKKSCSM